MHILCIRFDQNLQSATPLKDASGCSLTMGGNLMFGNSKKIFEWPKAEIEY